MEGQKPPMAEIRAEHIDTQSAPGRVFAIEMGRMQEVQQRQDMPPVMAPAVIEYINAAAEGI